jgi:hypothetical protein
MRILKTSDVNSPNTPKKPYAPTQEVIKDKNLFVSFRTALAAGRIKWTKDTGGWIELKDKNAKPFFYTFYDGYINQSKLYRIDIYFYPDPDSEGKNYNRAIVNLYFEGSSQDVATWGFESDDIMGNSQLLDILAKLLIRGLKAPTSLNDDYIPKNKNVRLTSLSTSREVNITVSP